MKRIISSIVFCLCFSAVSHGQYIFSLSELQQIAKCSDEDCAKSLISPKRYSFNERTNQTGQIIFTYKSGSGLFSTLSYLFYMRRADGIPSVQFSSMSMRAFVEKIMNQLNKEGFRDEDGRQPTGNVNVDSLITVYKDKKERLYIKTEKGFQWTLNISSYVMLTSSSGDSWGMDCMLTGEKIETAQNGLPKGQLFYFPFDSSAKDLSGNQNHGKLINKPVFVTDRFNNPKSALALNGKNQYVLVPNSYTLQKLNNELTVAIWAKVKDWYSSSYDAWAPLFCKCDGGSPYLQLALRKASSGYFFHTEGAAGSVQVKPDLSNNRWFHIAVTAKGNERKFYHNGVLIHSSNQYGVIQPSENPLYIGMDPHTVEDYLIGAIDDVMVYNRRLNSSEIETVYKYRRVPKQPSVPPQESKKEPKNDGPPPSVKPEPLPTSVVVNGQVLRKGESIALNSIQFEQSKSYLLPEGKVELNRVVQLMKEYTTLVIELSGHTSNEEKDETLNLKLSEARVMACKNYIANQVENVSSRIKTVGCGSSKPRVSNDTNDNRKKNRRVELKVVSL